MFSVTPSCAEFVQGLVFAGCGIRAWNGKGYTIQNTTLYFVYHSPVIIVHVTVIDEVGILSLPETILLRHQPDYVDA